MVVITESTLGLNNSTSKLAGIPSILGMKSSIPVVRHSNHSFLEEDQANREDQERRTRLLAILMRRSQPIQESVIQVSTPNIITSH
jgi:hypothetical protein